mmetsp:Transcript_11082/g.31581  ORF Transcript_11082/g.31581 Transcript_11082/m.31581 type:complete len:226 (-) Transcript_11082:21-698(-)
MGAFADGRARNAELAGRVRAPSEDLAHRGRDERVTRARRRLDGAMPRRPELRHRNRLNRDLGRMLQAQSARAAIEPPHEQRALSGHGQRVELPAGHRTDDDPFRQRDGPRHRLLAADDAEAQLVGGRVAPSVKLHDLFDHLDAAHIDIAAVDASADHLALAPANTVLGSDRILLLRDRCCAGKRRRGERRRDAGGGAECGTLVAATQRQAPQSAECRLQRQRRHR